MYGSDCSIPRSLAPFLGETTLIHMYLDVLLNIILPRTCLGCHTRGTSLCPKCLEVLPRAVGTETTTDTLYDYNHPVLRRAIWRLKYSGDRTLADIFGSRMAEEYLEEHAQLISRLSYGSPILLIPVPSSRKRYFERGYNQAELLTQAMVEKDTSVWERADVLYKIKDNKRQALIKDRSERIKNMSDTIAVKDKSRVSGRVCIVVDDVITTGATMRACMDALVSAGALATRGIAIAHGEKMW